MSNTAKKKNSKSNVVQLRAPDTDLVYRRALVGWAAIEEMIDRLKSARVAANKGWKRTLAEAKGAYSGGRPHADIATEALRQMVEVDRLAELIGGLAEATKECRSAGARAESGQSDMFDTGTASEVAGMGWASQPTKAAIFSCLRSMAERGETLDAAQAELLADLGGAGLDAMDLGMDASEAVESDEGAEAEPEDEEYESDEDDVGF